jgi:hypothetical protein
MKHDKFCLYTSILCLSLTVSPALWAGLSRDAGKASVIGDEGTWTLESTVQYEKEPEGRVWSIETGVQHTPSFAPSFSVVLETSFQEWEKSDREPGFSGYGDTEVSLYYLLAEDEDMRPAVILGAKAKLATARAPEIGTGKEDYGIILVVGKEFGELDINLELEWETFGQPDPLFDEEGELEDAEKLEDRLSATLSVDYGLTENLSLFVELVGAGRETVSEKDEFSIGGGLEFDVEITDVIAVFIEMGADTEKLLNAAMGFELNW